MPPVRVLLVDDSSAFLDSASRFLSIDPQVGVVGCAMSGSEALERIDELHPDLVLMDLAMPGMNGLEATERIKAQPGGPLVVILTLHDSPEYRAAADTARADGFVTKSQLAVHLLPLIHRLFGESAGKPAGVELLMKKILVVDDSPTMRRMVMASLRGLQGASFDEAATGLEAIERLTLDHVDLMVLDLNIPDMHGIDVLQFMRSHQAFRAIPIVVLTTRRDEESRAEALASGASLYLTKPFEPALMAMHVRQLLERAA